MTSDKTWRLEAAIDRAYEDFLALEDDHRNQLNMLLMARRYAPSTSKQCVDCLRDNAVLLFLEAKPGYLILDVLIAGITDVIGNHVMQRYTDTVKLADANDVRRKLLIPQ